MKTYTSLLRRPGAPGFVGAGFLGRLPISMIPLGIVLLVAQQDGSYALAGAMSATFALSAAVVAPLGMRWADRSGQHRAIPVLALAEAAALVGFIVAAEVGWGSAWQFAFLFVAGATSPNIGSLVRARWVAQVGGTPQVGAAFALEAIVDELVFIIGPPLMTLVAFRSGAATAIAACVLLILIGGLGLAAQRASQPSPAVRPSVLPAGQLRSRPFLMVLIVLCLLGGVFGSFEISTIAGVTALGSPALTGLVLALYAVGSLLSGLVVGTRTSTSDPGTRMLRLSLLLVVATIPLLWADTLVTTAAAALVAGAAVAPILIHTTTQVEAIVPTHRITEALGISISAITVGVAVANPVTGALVDAAAADRGYLVMFACALGMVAAALIGRRTPPRFATAAVDGHGEH